MGMSRRISSTPTISLASLARLTGTPVSTLYATQPQARGPILLTEAITFLEGELAALYRDQPRARRIRKMEDGLREMRVQRALDRIRFRDGGRRRSHRNGPVQYAVGDNLRGAA